MAGIREAKRQALKNRLMGAATQIIKEQGVRGLNARNVTTKAGCALGSIYTVFEDLDDLIVHVNSQTLAELGRALQEDVSEAEEPAVRLKTLAVVYTDFARRNFELWNALFEFADMTNEVPEWHQQEQAVLINFIKTPVMALSPTLSENEAEKRARTLFAAVHGVVAFSLQQRYIGLPEEELKPELMRFVDQMIAGL